MLLDFSVVGAADSLDINTYAKRLVASVRAFANSSLLQCLSDKRTEEEKAAIVNEFFMRYEKDVIANPSEHGTPFDIIYVYVRKDSIS